MSGVIVIRALLVANSALIAQVPATHIMAGLIPLGSMLPAISLAQISGVVRPTLSMHEARTLCADRVQVTVMAKTYAQQKQLLALVCAACVNTHARINGIDCDSVIPDTTGPDIFDADLGIYFQSQDYKVTFIR